MPNLEYERVRILSIFQKKWIAQLLMFCVYKSHNFQNVCIYTKKTLEIERVKDREDL